MRKIVIGVMGPGDNATKGDRENAYQLGRLIAQADWVLLTGGRNVGVMDAANKGAKAAGGLTVGILPGNNTYGISEAVDIAIATDLGNARNNLNVLSSDVVIACGIGAGTASEIALALKAGKPAILLTEDRIVQDFFTSIARSQLLFATNPPDAIALVRGLITDN
ncbi:TIGR00725 family protein [Oscillatoria salina]|uniref:TIGR00725 family protein n=1 Tax=Oscillatoria salina TaxID=331517 RepID=UPI0013BE484E|nr:TIGR00725 family protein [Oscillatoria salina]MBZ8180306.1 TIGR00725 family protein [Oscillatoria salina IIICB1]NET90528.1 TIGR00725 family protein [Kamptonema sp. SIO1D9]